MQDEKKLQEIKDRNEKKDESSNDIAPIIVPEPILDAPTIEKKETKSENTSIFI